MSASGEPMRKFYRFVLINIGILLVAAGVVVFKVPNKFATGGVSGIAIILNKLLPDLPVGLLMLIVNALLLIVGFLFASLDFGMKTVYSSIVLSLLTWFLERIIPLQKPLTGDSMLELIFAILLIAAGSALLFYRNASSGGTDILAKILNQKMNWHIGKSLLAVDFIISLIAIPVFGFRAGMYSVLGVILKGLLIDEVIKGLHSSKQLVIISCKAEDIRNFIILELNRGVTIYAATGGKTGEQKLVLNTVMGNKEAIRLRRYIRRIDDRAFIIASTVSEIYGEGFQMLDL